MLGATRVRRIGAGIALLGGAILLISESSPGVLEFSGWSPIIWPGISVLLALSGAGLYLGANISARGKPSLKS